MHPTNFLEPEAGVHLPKLPEQAPELHHAHPSRKRRRRKMTRRIVYILLATAFIAVAIFLGIGGSKLAQDSLALKAAGEGAKTALENGDVQGAHVALGEVVTGIHAVRADLSYFGFVKTVPLLGDQVTGAEATLDAAGQAADALYSGLTVFLDALSSVEGASDLIGVGSGAGESRSYSTLTEEEKYLLLHSLSVALPELRRMQVNLRLAKLDLDRLDSLNLAPQFARAVLPLQQKLPELIDAVDIVVPFAAIAPQFAGLGSEHQFLLMFLNNHELRPGGGFIGNYALLTMKNGDIKSMVTDDSYAVDALVLGHPDYHVEPPIALKRFMNLSNWYFRDSNWSPDFKESSEVSVQLMRQEFAYGGKPVPNLAGTIGITTDFLSRVIEFIGPITVDGETFTSDNVTDKLEYIVEQAFDCANAPLADRARCVNVPVSQRKLIIKHMTEVMMDRLKGLSPSKWPAFFRVLHEAFAKKEIVFMSMDGKTQAVIEDAGWGGVLNPIASDDVFMMVDANMGAYKTDRVVDREVTYSVRPNGAGFRATASIQYANTATKKDYRTIDYRTYSRVYAPLGSTLVSTTGASLSVPQCNPQYFPNTPSTFDEVGLTSFGACVFVPIGQTRTLTFTYDLPAHVVDAIRRGDYALQVYKQIGARDNLLTIDEDFGKAVRDATPAESPIDWGDKKYHLETVLDTDKEFRVRL
ncbi:MAG: DUF4012 domain-containing protein [Patescibacteria group bacterium]|jgi:hypothetical protein